ncbi:hypothetical protein PILCRDRAFT_92798 [Piloderma croceum F 1598]|uniref:Integrase core domain-containing protein n=1 Tax=Piloderma croceum (strain F 1598) TaxID=765440 RepID=A0A0C3AJC5_PILCF|nr:hypothetical protein PILCRDRAFT_92798 [Piloderma croceum F 1598]
MSMHWECLSDGVMSSNNVYIMFEAQMLYGIWMAMKNYALGAFINKKSNTLEVLFMAGVEKYGWPSQGRGDYGRENNRAEWRMIIHWGVAHRPCLHGRSLQNIRIEWLWRDVCKDTLEMFRQIFFHLEEPRIQKSLDETVASWNFHKVRTAGNRTPTAMYKLNCQHAINRGYWSGDPGDDMATATDPSYGHDPTVPMPPVDELSADPTAPVVDKYIDLAAEKEAGVFVTGDDEIEAARRILRDWDLAADDGNWRIDMYCQAVIRLSSYLASAPDGM